MAKNSPWMQATSEARYGPKFLVSPDFQWLIGIIIIIFLLAILSLKFYQPIRVIAHQFFYSFINLPTEQISIQLEPQNPEIIYQESDPRYFPDTFHEVQELAGFQTKELTVLPDGLALKGTRYDPEYGAVIALYETNSYRLFLTQRLLNNGKDVFTVGPDSKIISVDIGQQQGEYVAGGWKAIYDNENYLPENTTSIEAVWDDDLPQFTLRWQQDGFSYEIRILGDESPSLSELIAIAIGLK
jgi:hypothetical protein